MERWKILHSAKNLKLKAGTRNESCGRFGKRTPFLRGRVQLQQAERQKSSHCELFFLLTIKKTPPDGGVFVC